MAEEEEGEEKEQGVAEEDDDEFGIRGLDPTLHEKGGGRNG